MDFVCFSNEEKSQWLIDIAHDICDPAHKCGHLVVWHNQGWHDVYPTDPLIESTYHYLVPSGIAVSLTKISARVGRSRADATEQASTMANHVEIRDGHKCWISGTIPITNSHVIPKRMGDHMLCVVYNTFVQMPPPALSIYDEICGITLSRNLDSFFHEYEIGLRFVALVRVHIFLSSAVIHFFIHLEYL